MKDKDKLMVTYRDDGLMNVWKCPPGGPLVSMAVVGSREELELRMTSLGYEFAGPSGLPHVDSWRKARA